MKARIHPSRQPYCGRYPGQSLVSYLQIEKNRDGEFMAKNIKPTLKVEQVEFT